MQTVYLTSGGNIQAMNQTDVNDTFLHPAIDLLVASFSSKEGQGGVLIQWVQQQLYQIAH